MTTELLEGFIGAIRKMTMSKRTQQVLWRLLETQFPARGWVRVIK
jgi:hypothetical protein